MSSVTGRIGEIKQPRGGYIKPSQFEEITFNDDIELTKSFLILMFLFSILNTHFIFFPYIF